MPEPAPRPDDVPDRLYRLACEADAEYDLNTPSRERAWKGRTLAVLAAVLPEHERRVREQVAAEISEPSAWPDPMGRWTADQADAARAMKEHIIRRIARGETR